MRNNRMLQLKIIDHVHSDQAVKGDYKDYLESFNNLNINKMSDWDILHHKALIQIMKVDT